MEMAGPTNPMVDFFLQLLQMTKRMTDDVLPDQLLKLDRISLQELATASNDANNSLAVFAKLCDIFAKKDLAGQNKNNGQNAASENLSAPAKKTSGSNSISKSSDIPQQTSIQQSGGSKAKPASAPVSAKEELLWRNVLEKIRSRYENNLKSVDMFYCGLCNVHADYLDVWGSHLSGKKHKEMIVSCQNDQVQTQFCHACRLFVIGESRIVDLVLNSAEHRHLDSTVKSQNGRVEPSAKAPSKASEPVKSNKQMEANAAKPASRQIPKVVTYNRMVISEQFIEVNSSIKQRLSNHKEFTIFFCRPCEAIKPSMDEWKLHKELSYHKQKMSNKQFKNVQALCTLCRFGMIASETVAVAYMLYHVDVCHNFTVAPGHVEEYIEIKHLAPHGMSSSRSSFKGSCDSVASNHQHQQRRRSRKPAPSSGRSTPQERSSVGRRESPAMSAGSDHGSNLPDTRRRESEATASDHGSSIKTVHSNNSITNNSGQAEADDDVSLFVKMLDAKEGKFRLDPTYKPFSAFCMLCPQLNISDQFSWYDHVGIHASDDDQNEVECSECNSFVYGSLQTITEELIPHPRHLQIDSLMSRV